MKIVHICLCGGYNDGWGYQENLLTKHNKLDGHDVTIITSRYVHDKSTDRYELHPELEYESPIGIKIIRLKNLLVLPIGVNSRTRMYRGLYQRIAQEKPDILFLHGGQFFNGAVVKYKKENPNVKIYVDNHSDFFNSANNWFSKHILHQIIWRVCVRRILPYIETYWAITPDCKEFLVRMYKVPEDRIRYLYLGADLPDVTESEKQRIRQSIRKSLQIPDESVVLISGGKINAEKKIETLLDALTKIESKKISLILFGSIVDDMKNVLTKKIESDDRVQYVGWIDSSKVIQYYWASDFAVFPGSQSVLWQQAIAAGLPCIFRHWDGVDYLDVGENCIFLENDDANELAEKIESLLDKDLRDQMARAAAAKGAKTFSYSIIAKRAIGQKK